MLPEGLRQPALVQSVTWMLRPVEMMRACERRFGSRFTIRFTGGRNYVLVHDAEAVKAVFTGSPDVFVSGRGNENFAPFLGQHSLLVMRPGDKHRQHRRVLGPPLRGERMRAYGDLLRELTLEDVARWPVGQPFPIIEAMRRITLQVIFRAIFGVTDTTRLERLAHLTSELTRRVAWFAFLRLPQIDLGPRSPWGHFLRMRREFDRLLGEEIATARAQPGGREDILSKLIEEGDRSGQPLPDAEICDAMITMLAAGHETSTATAAFAIQWILGDRQVAERLMTELHDRVGDGPVQPEHVDELPYVSAAVYETLRMTPVIPIVPRWLAEDAQIGETTLPAGTYVAPCPFLAHHDPKRYPEPDSFRPERFLGQRPGPFDFFPFGGGIRLCIGAPFALYEITAILANVLLAGRLRLAFAPPQRIGRHGLTLVPARGTPVIFEGRR